MILTKLSNIANDINTLLFPKACFGCNARLIGGENHLCTVCRHQLPLTEYTFNEENPVDRIFYGRINVKKASSFLHFTDFGIVKNLIHNLKYRSQEHIGEFLGSWYGQIIKENNHLPRIDYVIPVPLHRKKLRKRGYNQTALFANQLAQHLNTEYLENVLIKTANTRTQTKKNRLARWYENKSLYIITNPGLIKNKTVLLVDDVITTGATMELCGDTLLKAGVANLFIASMAIVD